MAPPEEGTRSRTNLRSLIKAKAQGNTKLDSPLSAAQKVLYIPELLIEILFYLPPESLLRAQSTTTLFHSIITASTHIQQILCFKPPLGDNPLIKTLFAPLFTSEIGRMANKMGRYRSPSTPIPPKAVEHPESLKGVFRYGRRSLEMLVEGSPTGTAAEKHQRRNAFLRKEASWRKMFLFGEEWTGKISVWKTMQWVANGEAGYSGYVRLWGEDEVPPPGYSKDSDEEQEDSDDDDQDFGDDGQGREKVKKPEKGAVIEGPKPRLLPPPTLGFIYDLIEDWTGKFPDTNCFNVDAIDGGMYISLHDTRPRPDGQKTRLGPWPQEPAPLWKTKYRSEAFEERTVIYPGYRPYQCARFQWQWADHNGRI